MPAERIGLSEFAPRRKNLRAGLKDAVGLVFAGEGKTDRLDARDSGGGSSPDRCDLARPKRTNVMRPPFAATDSVGGNPSFNGYLPPASCWA